MTLLDEVSRPGRGVRAPGRVAQAVRTLAEPATRKPQSRAIGTAATHGRGEGVLIGIIDVGGFDFAHRISPAGWERRGSSRSGTRVATSARRRQGFDYGSEFTQAQLNAAIEAAKQARPAAGDVIERQSQLQPGSHGTHVASIAAGNSGVCPKAEDRGGADRRAAARRPDRAAAHDLQRHQPHHPRGRVPARDRASRRSRSSINISLGTNGGAHDGSSGVSRWLDAYLAAPGRAICVAAGNAGQEKAQSRGRPRLDHGADPHSGQIPARGLEVELEWTVVGDGIEDVSENELEIWYGAQDRFIVSLKPPGASEWIEVKPREYVENRRLPSGMTVSIYNELYHPTNGAQLHRGLSLPQPRSGQFPRHPARRVASAAQGRRGPRRAVRRLDRARRSRWRSAGERPAPVPLPVVLHRGSRTSTRTRSARWRAAIA